MIFRSVAFDVDGTLIDTRLIMISCLQEALLEVCQKDYSFDELGFIYGIPLAKGISMLACSDPHIVIQKFYEYWERGARQALAFKGIPELLKELKAKNITTGIVTSRVRLEIERDRKLLRLMRHIECSVTADETTKKKPDAEPLLKFLKISGSQKETSIYIGDTVYDYQCAKNAGIAFGLALWGAADKRDIKADYILEHPADLLKLV